MPDRHSRLPRASMVKMPSLAPGQGRFPSMDLPTVGCLLTPVAYAGKIMLVPVLLLMMANGYHPIYDRQALA